MDDEGVIHGDLTCTKQLPFQDEGDKEEESPPEVTLSKARLSINTLQS